MVESRRAAYRRIDRLSARDIKTWPKWMQKTTTVKIQKIQSFDSNIPEVKNAEPDFQP